ncbi:hypothetical protein DAMA08_045940 [Martiniozyma asiatica (nom. inval.)]|nr:hypothetical protein DAMA08_045940 [Martiniozyma asiatica]
MSDDEDSYDSDTSVSSEDSRRINRDENSIYADTVKKKHVDIVYYSLSNYIQAVLQNPEYLKLLLDHHNGIFEPGGYEDAIIGKEELEEERMNSPDILWLHFVFHIDGVNVLSKSSLILDIPTMVLLDLPHNIGLRKEMVFTPMIIPSINDPNHFRQLWSNFTAEMQFFYSIGQIFRAGNGNVYRVKVKIIFACSDNMASAPTIALPTAKSTYPCLYCNVKRKYIGRASICPVSSTAHLVNEDEMSQLLRMIKEDPLSRPTWPWYHKKWGPKGRSMLGDISYFNPIRSCVIDVFHMREEWLITKGLIDEASHGKFLNNYGVYGYKESINLMRNIKLFKDSKLEKLEKHLFHMFNIHLTASDYNAVMKAYTFFFNRGVMKLPKDLRNTADSDADFLDMIILRFWCQLLTSLNYDVSKNDLLVQNVREWAISVQNTADNEYMGLHWHHLPHAFEQRKRVGDLSRLWCFISEQNVRRSKNLSKANGSVLTQTNNSNFTEFGEINFKMIMTRPVGRDWFNLYSKRPKTLNAILPYKSTGCLEKISSSIIELGIRKKSRLANVILRTDGVVKVVVKKHIGFKCYDNLITSVCKTKRLAHDQFEKLDLNCYANLFIDGVCHLVKIMDILEYFGYDENGNIVRSATQLEFYILKATNNWVIYNDDFSICTHRTYFPKQLNVRERHKCLEIKQQKMLFKSVSMLPIRKPDRRTTEYFLFEDTSFENLVKFN